jgi:peptidoglycan/LPS O-acetylase OafA/YrhL
MDHDRPCRQLEALRIIAALGIVTLHFSTGLLQGQSVLWPGAQSLELFVDTFFVISGFVIASSHGRLNSPIAYRSFVLSRLLRLLPLHWIMTGVVMLLALGHASQAVAPWLHERSCLVPTLLLLHATGLCSQMSLNFVSWSVSAELIVYLLTPAIVIVAGTGKRGLITAALLIAMMSLSDLTGSNPWYQRTLDAGILRALPAYLTGVSFFLLRDRLARIDLPAPAMTIGVVAFVVLALARAPEGALLPFAYLLPAIAIVLDLRGRQDRIGTWLAPHGVKTYAIYMVHLPIVFAVSLIRTDDQLTAMPQLVACLALVFTVGSLAHRFVDRPIHRSLARLRVAFKRVRDLESLRRFQSP